MLFRSFPLGRADWRLPIQIGDLVERTEMVFRGTVTFEAPTHAVRLVVPDDLHVVHMTVAGHATDAAVHVGRVVKINVIGRLVDADPGNRLAGFPGLADGLELGALGFNLGVAIHAGLGGGNVGVGGFFHLGMAVPAVHPELVDVEGVIKLDGLGGLVADPGVLRGKVVSHP